MDQSYLDVSFRPIYTLQGISQSLLEVKVKYMLVHDVVLYASSSKIHGENEKSLLISILL